MEQIRKLQNVELEMLKQFDKVCKKYEIDYFALFGTALGAVRHNGFIPWDDDVDVGMLRSDYERLKRIPNSEWNGLLLVDGCNDCFYHEKIFPRLYKPGTVFETTMWKKYYDDNKHDKKPVWIDIFLFDYIDSEENAKKMAKQAKRLNMFYFYSKYKTNINQSDSLKQKLKCIGKRIMHYFCGMIHDSKYYYQKYVETVSKGEGSFIISYDSWLFGTIMDTLAPYSFYFPSRKLQFEDFEISVPFQVEKFLSKRYKNYMELPPENQRKGHIPFFISLGKDE